jgi:hypothetical protein
MKIRFLLIASAILLLLCPLLQAQDQGPAQYVAAGVALNQYAAPQISGTLLYAKQVTAVNTYSFTLVDVISKSLQPFEAATSISSGVAQQILKLEGIRIFATTTVGMIAGGEDIGWSWTGGGAAAIPLGKSGFSLLPSVRFLASGLTERQMIYGLAIGFGK